MGLTTAGDLTLALARSAGEHGDRPALRAAGATLSYAQLDRASSAFAALLGARGVRRGDRVGLMVPNSPVLAAAYHGILRAGAVVVPLSQLLRAREVRALLADADASCLVLWHACPDVARVRATTPAKTLVSVDARWLAWGTGAAGSALAPAPADPEALAVLQYSSGTTGAPKGIELTHGNIAAAARMTAAALDGLLDRARVLAAAPLFHGYGQGCGMNAPLLAGACVSLFERFDADAALDAIERERITLFVGVPTMFARLLAAQRRTPRDLGSLRVCLSGGGALAPDLLHDCEQHLGAEMLEGYGSSEMLRTAVNRHGDRRTGSVGKPLPGVEVELRDEAGRAVPLGGVGEVVVRAPSVMRGYWRRPDQTAAVLRGGWLHTGDLARLDRDGRIWLVGRTKDIIIRGGYTVYPPEVEAVLAAHPAVAEAAVVGVADEEFGEEVAAAVVLRAGARDVSAAELLRWLRDELAPHKRPRVLWMVDALPRGVTGKVLREPLRIAARARA